MKPLLVLALAVLLPALLVSRPASAGSLDGTVIALHSTAKVDKTCTTAAPTFGCSSYVTDQQPLLTALTVYLVAAQAPVGIAGISCGISASSSVVIRGWEQCADLDFPNGGWPMSGGGARLTWSASTNCQTTRRGDDGIHAIGGAFYVYAYGDGCMEVTPNPGLVIPEFKVADCSAAESDVQTCIVGVVGFGTFYGWNPCGMFCGDPPYGVFSTAHGSCADVVPATPSTWGTIKAFGSSD